jgi:bifunctional DNA-binding transcriptional regulator/antitoxin component of YhaV-PrlF toxin-antitoxin module
MNNQKILAVDALARIQLPKDLRVKIGLNASLEGLHVGILRTGIAVGSEMPLDCVYSYPVKPDGLNRVSLNVYVKAALGLTPPDRIIIDRIEEGNYFIARRYIATINDLVVLSHADELGRVFIPTPVLREISEDKPEGLYVQGQSVNGTSCLIASSSNNDGQYRVLNGDIPFIDLKDELHLINVDGPCAVLLKTGEEQVIITRA